MGLLNELTLHSCALSLYSISLTSPSFVDDISLLSIYPTFLSYKSVHSEAMKERTWVLGGESVAEL